MNLVNGINALEVANNKKNHLYLYLSERRHKNFKRQNMSLYCYKSLNNRGVLKTLASLPLKVISQPYAGGIKLKYEKPPCREELYKEKNSRLGRPLSPYLTIYSVQMTSAMSLMHRLSGLMLTTYAMTLGLGALILPQDLSHYVTMLEGQEIPVSSIYAAKTVLAAPFCYHFSNGIRHLIWDLGKMLKLQSVFRSGYLVIVLTVASTAWLVHL